jgi:hypothetical protein
MPGPPRRSCHRRPMTRLWVHAIVGGTSCSSAAAPPSRQACSRLVISRVVIPVLPHPVTRWDRGRPPGFPTWARASRLQGVAVSYPTAADEHEGHDGLFAARTGAPVGGGRDLITCHEGHRPFSSPCWMTVPQETAYRAGGRFQTASSTRARVYLLPLIAKCNSRTGCAVYIVTQDSLRYH